MQLCAQQRWGEHTTAPSLLLPAQATLQNLCVCAMGSCWHRGELRGGFSSGDAKSQAFSRIRCYFVWRQKSPFGSVLCWSHSAVLRVQRRWGCSSFGMQLIQEPSSSALPIMRC